MKQIGIYVSVCFFFIPFLLVGVFSAVFFKRLLVRIRIGRRIGNTPDVRPNAVDANPANGINTRKQYMKSAVTLTALVSAMCVSMLPYSIYLLVAGASGGFSPIVTEIMWIIVQLNPLLDPIFYAATQKQLREFYWKNFRGLLLKRLYLEFLNNV